MKNKHKIKIYPYPVPVPVTSSIFIINLPALLYIMIFTTIKRVFSIEAYFLYILSHGTQAQHTPDSKNYTTANTMHVINTMGNTKLSIVVVQASTTVQTTKDTMIFGRNINVAPQSTAPTWNKIIHTGKSVRVSLFKSNFKSNFKSKFKS
jgi:hypothetical protein